MTIATGPRPIDPPAVRRTRSGREVWVDGSWLPAADPRAQAALSRPRPENPPGPIVRRRVEPEAATEPAVGDGSGYRLTATQAHEHRVRGGKAAAAKRVARSRPQAPDHPFRRPFSQGTQPKEGPMPATAPPETPSGRTPPAWKVERACEEDGTLFMPRDRHQVLCSRDCSRARAARILRERAEAKRAATEASEPEHAPDAEPSVEPPAASSDGQVAAPDHVASGLMTEAAAVELVFGHSAAAVDSHREAVRRLIEAADHEWRALRLQLLSTERRMDELATTRRWLECQLIENATPAAEPLEAVEV